MTSLSVVVPFYNHWNLVHQTLWDLYKRCRDSLDEVLLVNDASTDDEVYQGMQFWKTGEMLPVKELRLKENQKFLRAANKGMAKASGDVLVLLSNDVRLNGDICKKISDIILHDEKVLIGGRYLDWSTGWNNFGTRIYPYLEGWLLACTKETWLELGGFDDDLAPHDYEDITLSTKAVSLGYTLVALPEKVTHHIGAQSIGYNPEREAITNRNKEIFRRKWVDKKDV